METTTKVGMTCDMRVIAQILGQRTYSNSVLQVAVKELLQNAYDACKPLHRGNVSIDLRAGTNPKSGKRGKYLKVTDNGIGMTTDTVINVYLRMGGTLKEGLSDSEKSGGFGIAKIQYLTQSEAIEIRSIRDGKLTTVITTAEELFSNETEVTVTDTELPNGTEIVVWYPDSVDIRWPYNTYPDHYGLDKPCLGYPDIHVFYSDNGDYPTEVCTIDSKRYTAKSHISFEWGDIDIFYAPQEYRAVNSSKPVMVLSAGLFQFNQDFRDKLNTSLKFSVIMNIKSKVDAHALNYPINNSREGFSPAVKEDIETLQKYLFDIQRVLNAEMVRQYMNGKTHLPYTEVDGTVGNVKIAQAKQPKLSEEFLTKVAEAFMTCKSVYEEKPIAKEAVAEIAKSEVQSEVSTKDQLTFLNKTNGNYISVAAFSKIASILRDTLDTMGLKDIHAGIVLEKHTAGCFLQESGTKTILVNPLSSSVTDSGEWFIYDMLNTIIHEVAHNKTPYHGESHNEEMRDVAKAMHVNGTYLTTENKLRKVWLDHSDELRIDATEFVKATNIQ